jgi:translation initiation factor 2 subunit 1
MKLEEWPERGELVVLKIKRIMNYGAIAELSEYPGKEGFIHISNIATSWIKNIRSFVSEGQVRVASVIRIDQAKRTVDISLRKVSKAQEKRRLEDWKREKRADKLFERVCHEIGEEFQKSYHTVAIKLIDEFGDLLSAFENASSVDDAFKDIDIAEKWKKAITKTAKENIVISEVTVKGDLLLSSNKGDGLLAIKDTLEKVLKHTDVKLEYISAPRYRVEVTALNYQEAEKMMDSVVAEAVDYLKAKGGEGSFERIKT